MTILDAQGNDIGTWLADDAAAAGIPVQLPLACGIAESNLNPRAERWGRETVLAQAAIASGDMDSLQVIIDRAGSDVSFGIGQRVVKYHYYGTGQMTVQNCLNVRAYVFAHEAEDIWEMCRFLAPRFVAAGQADLSPVDGDRLLMALCAYNAGHVPLPSESYWTGRASTIQRYRESLERAATMLAETSSDVHTEIHTEGPMTAIDERAAEAAIKDALGAALTEEIPLTDCTVRAYNNALLIDVPGAGVYCLAEATVAEGFPPKA